MNNAVLTVSDLNCAVKQTLQTQFGSVWIVGEISNFSQPLSGHWYLTLKDERSQVRCAMFRMKNMAVRFPVRNGMQVLVKASVSLYEARGDYQILIETMQLAGDGLLQQQFEQLKMKLSAEGLFAQERKKSIPRFVKKVGIITSPTGAALQDILNILHRRDPSLAIVIYPSLVQCREAAQDIVRMIELANLRQECDVLIVGRGGGSLEDLWCFNEESVARAIFASQLPIISAVGHETDITIADFVADLRAPTPSAAAELVSRDQQELALQLQQQADKISLAFDRVWSEKIGKFQQLKIRLNAQQPANQLQIRRKILLQHQQRAYNSLFYQLSAQRKTLEQLALRLQLQHPIKMLQRQQQSLTYLEKRASQQIEQIFLHKQQRWQYFSQRTKQYPLPHQLKQSQQRLEKIAQQLSFEMQKKFRFREQCFHTMCAKLHSLSPLNVLSRGYSVTQNLEGKALISTRHIQLGETLKTRLAEGEITSQVIEIRAK